MKNERKLRILVVGQTPPPLGGQAVMIQTLLDGTYTNVELFHVRMDFSRDLNASGKLGIVKLWVLVRVVMEILYTKVRRAPDVLYYPPAGPRFLPVARDMFVLCFTRWLFRLTVFHFHASGLTDYRARLNPLLRKIFDLAYSRPDVAIRISKSAPAEGPRLGCKREFIIANGIEDRAGCAIVRSKQADEPIRILFVALLTEVKGVLMAIEAVHALAKAGVRVQLTCMGQWESREVQSRAEALIDPALRHCFEFPGVLVGEDKWEYFRKADIFCFPSHFHSETFPLVLLEAMCFSLPVVSTLWRGIPDVVQNGVNAILVEPHDLPACVSALALLVRDQQMRTEMATKSRERFTQNFTVNAHRKELEVVFQSLRGSL
jgi:glycosyltransferase involved in cell wall biosynthesis